jgi:hypothetical protein
MKQINDNAEGKPDITAYYVAYTINYFTEHASNHALKNMYVAYAMSVVASLIPNLQF